jgi:hypothetical protein
MWSRNWFLHVDKAAAHRALSVKRFMAKESIVKRKRSSHLLITFDSKQLLAFSEIDPHLEEADISGRREDFQKNVTAAFKFIPKKGVYKCWQK